MVIPDGGDCFVTNGQEFTSLVDTTNYVIVHGIVKNSIDGLPMSHCWIEKIIHKDRFSYTVCLDYSNGNTVELPKELYYYFGKIKEEDLKKYTREEYLEKIIQSSNWGPWDIKCDR